MSPILVPILALLIPIIAILSKLVFQPWLEMKNRAIEQQSVMTAEKAAQYGAHVERLEQRVRVLERIVTDRGLPLADEIERLRDERPDGLLTRG